ncbi:MAG: hypothetical protein ACLSSW_01925 [Acutalibacteraceae bacterium]|jgi:divalent metal cation (Fe/Co/Zn/Cd) transporter
MWISIILSILFLAITTIFFTAELRQFPMYRSLSFFFLFEGFYTLADFIVTELWPNFRGMAAIHNVGCLILGIYVTITLYKYKKSKIKEINSEKEIKNAKTPDE